jgi:hypothetical protein
MFHGRLNTKNSFFWLCSRIRKAGIHLTVCVDSIAASGGYMMASVADNICAGEWADTFFSTIVVGSSSISFTGCHFMNLQLPLLWSVALVL